MKAFLGISMVVSILLSLPEKGEADLLFCGESSSGWQIFRSSDTGKGVSQLTRSLGDKRGPRFEPSSRTVYCRNSLGQVCRVSTVENGGRNGEITPVFTLDEISDFWPFGSVIYYNRLATGNSQRRFVWSFRPGGATEEPIQMVFRRDIGSLRQVRISPSGKMGVVTYLWRRGEERLVVFPLQGESAGKEWRELTPEYTVAAYPVWETEHSILYSKKVAEGNFDLYRVSVESGESTPVVTTDFASEFSATVTRDGNAIFFERQIHSSPGSSEICRFDVSKGELDVLPLSFSAKEPFWFDGMVDANTRKEGE